LKVADALTILWLGQLLALGSVLLVLGLAVFKFAMLRAQAAREAREGELVVRLVGMALGAEDEPMALRWTANSLMLAQVLSRALELVSGDACARLVQIAALAGCEKGLRAMARSRHTHDRISAARAMRHLPNCAALLRRMARRDASISVRAAAVQALGDMGQPPAARDWSDWVDLGDKTPHPSVRALFRHEALVSDARLADAVMSARASSTVRMWCLEALCERDPALGEPLAMEIAGTAGLDERLRAAAAALIRDPLALTVQFDAIAASATWRLLGALCAAAEACRATTLAPHLARLATHGDWRVRSAAVAALRALGGAPVVAPVSTVGRISLQQACAS
jgi:HEAT repeat